MTSKLVLSVILNILAVSLPVGILVRIFGVTATVNPQSARDILLLVGSAFFSFAVGMASSSIKGADRSPLQSILRDIVKERSAQEKRAA